MKFIISQRIIDHVEKLSMQKLNQHKWLVSTSEEFSRSADTLLKASPESKETIGLLERESKRRRLLSERAYNDADSFANAWHVLVDYQRHAVDSETIQV